MEKNKKSSFALRATEGHGKSKIMNDGYGDDLMSWVARFLVANKGKAPAPAELMAFIKSKN